MFRGSPPKSQGKGSTQSDAGKMKAKTGDLDASLQTDPAA